jgi:hypothetical protein
MAVGWAQRYAVIDGAHGQALVVAPSDRDLARQLRGERTFHCTTRAGGCGQVLILRAGDVNIPHFAHLSSDRHCDADADRWTHLHVQGLLHAWLTDVGRNVSIEQEIPGGRLDIAVHTTAGLIALEVQRAALDRVAWQQRTATYRAATRGLSWLWMDDAADLARRIELAEEGVTHALQLRFDASFEHRQHLQVRAMTCHQSGDWHDLRSCRLEVDGVRTPDWHRLALQSHPTEAAADTAPVETRAPRGAYERYYWAWNTAHPGIAATSIERAWRLQLPAPEAPAQR